MGSRIFVLDISFEDWKGLRVSNIIMLNVFCTLGIRDSFDLKISFDHSSDRYEIEMKSWFLFPNGI